MRQASSLHRGLSRVPGELGTAFLGWGASWWRVFHFGALALVMTLSPATYDRDNRAVTAKQIYFAAWQVLPWFALLSALLSMVLIRIVVASAQSYGLSQYALEMVVRVLGMEDRVPSAPEIDDYFNLLTTIGVAPLDGWTVDDPVTKNDLAVVMVQALGLQGEVMRNWQVYGGYAHLDGRITKPITSGTTATVVSIIPAGNKIGLVPEHTLSLWNRFTLGGQGRIYNDSVHAEHRSGFG